MPIRNLMIIADINLTIMEVQRPTLTTQVVVMAAATAMDIRKVHQVVVGLLV